MAWILVRPGQFVIYILPPISVLDRAMPGPRVLIMLSLMFTSSSVWAVDDVQPGTIYDPEKPLIEVDAETAPGDPSPGMLCARVEEQLSRIVSDLYGLSRTLFGEDLESDRLRGYLAFWQEKFGEGFDLRVFNTNGVEIFNKILSAESGFDHERDTTSHWKWLTEQNQPVMSEILLSPQQENEHCEILFPLFDGGGEWSGTLCLLVEPWTLFEQAHDQASVHTGTVVSVMQRDGWLLYVSDPEAYQGKAFCTYRDDPKPSLKEIFWRAVEEKKGTGLYTCFGEDGFSLENREVQWERFSFLEQQWIVMAEKKTPFKPSNKNPLSGRWMGAYAYSKKTPAPESTRPGGPLRVVVLQDGNWCGLVGRSEALDFTLKGAVMKELLAASGTDQKAQPWFLRGEWNQEEGVLKGTLAGHSDQAFWDVNYYLKKMTRGSGDSSGEGSRQ